MPTPIDGRRLLVHAGGDWALRGARCAGCGLTSHPHRSRCVACGAATEEVALLPEGSVVAATTVRMTRPDVLLDPPFQVVLVRLADGPLVRMPSRERAPLLQGEQVAVELLELHDGDEAVLAFEAVRNGVAP